MAETPLPDAKAEREGRLHWQSKVLLLLVLIVAAAGLVRSITASWSAATREGLAICAAFGALVWLLRAATPLAAVTGFLLTSCMYLGTVEQPSGGWEHTALLLGLALFVLAFAATRFRRSQKEQRGLAESRRGRGASQVAANMGAAAFAALPCLASPSLLSHSLTFARPILFTALIAALAEAAADTVSSEIGQAVGGQPRLLTSLKAVAPGTDGGITVAGSLAGCAAAAFVVLISMPTLRLNPRQAAIAWIAAIVGLFADSLIGATLERQGWLNNDLVNFLSTTIAALIVLALMTIF
ncbi:hypothetical protein ACPOL_1763 [Acidisarcina polymorpha]|uniref:DUF92 domain-containing protein n=1 Tax=Acidisarcina polymorpha TaxID=2211140 RepID=A0A2Z5FXJ3_9BACT|nr:DUF92 domain-containing protein [Acidisarcina polymorpha]AXC11105.1 hypothetical protein ACPOL_1763 [Acidisarcina polymorpha]